MAKTNQYGANNPNWKGSDLKREDAEQFVLTALKEQGLVI